MKTPILITHVNIMNTTQNKRNMIILAMKIQISIQKQFVIDVNRKVIVKWRMRMNIMIEYINA